MLEANPNLTYRDVQEILVRSARQNSPLEIASSGGICPEFAKARGRPTRSGRSRIPIHTIRSIRRVYRSRNSRLTDPNIERFIPGSAELSRRMAIDGGRQFASRYRTAAGSVHQRSRLHRQPRLRRVRRADRLRARRDRRRVGRRRWPSSGTRSARTSIRSLKRRLRRSCCSRALDIPAAERLPLNHSGLLIPGGIGCVRRRLQRITGMNTSHDDPFSSYTGLGARWRGASYIDFIVPADQAMNIEWVEVRVDISRQSEDLNNLRILLDFARWHAERAEQLLHRSEFRTVFSPTGFRPVPCFDPRAVWMSMAATSLWTFTTNRSWGESTNTQVIIDPVTGEPLFTMTRLRACRPSRCSAIGNSTSRTGRTARFTCTASKSCGTARRSSGALTNYRRRLAVQGHPNWGVAASAFKASSASIPMVTRMFNYTRRCKRVDRQRRRSRRRSALSST